MRKKCVCDLTIMYIWQTERNLYRRHGMEGIDSQGQQPIRKQNKQKLKKQQPKCHRKKSAKQRVSKR